MFRSNKSLSDKHTINNRRESWSNLPDPVRVCAVSGESIKSLLQAITLYVPYGSTRYGESNDVDLVRVRPTCFSRQVIDTIVTSLHDAGIVTDNKGNNSDKRWDSKDVADIVLSVLHKTYHVPATTTYKPTDEIVSAFPRFPREPFGVIVRACLNKDYPGIFSGDFIGNASNPRCLRQALEWHKNLRVNIGVHFPTGFTAKKALVAIIQHRAYVEWHLFVDTKTEYLLLASCLFPRDFVALFQQLLYDNPTDTRDIDAIFEYATARRRDSRKEAVLFLTRSGELIIRQGTRFWYFSGRNTQWKRIADTRLHYLDLSEFSEVGCFSSVAEAMRFAERKGSEQRFTDALSCHLVGKSP